MQLQDQHTMCVCVCICYFLSLTSTMCVYLSLSKKDYCSEPGGLGPKLRLDGGRGECVVAVDEDIGRIGRLILKEERVLVDHELWIYES